ncbi:MAG: hypothetical protein H6624_01775 [Bdellovibrionaceae bacterium]|nr:hypothetical protein [Bdellovibrionales bacterium]MCB9083037.1 hypothetical protein [Pseudobdellovibrionaceae bacterium]
MKRLLGLTICSLLVFSCTENAEPIHKHSGDVRTEKPATATQQDLSETLSPEVLLWQSKAANSQNPQEEILIPLAKQVLSPARIRRPEALTRRNVREELDLFNQVLLDEWKKGEKEQKTLKPILEKYVAAVSLDCEKIVDSCPGVAYFGLVPSSAEVMKISVKGPLNANEYYRRLAYALELKNRRLDRELLELLTYRLEQGQKQAKTRQQRELLVSVVETAILSLHRSNSEAEEEKLFLEKLRAWDFGFNKEMDLGESARVALFTMLARSGAFYDSGGGLHPAMTRLMVRSQVAQDSFTRRQDELKEQDIFAPEAVGLRFLNRRDEYFFLVDRVFYGDITSDQGAQLFSGTKLDRVRLHSTINDYVRIQFLYALYRSTRMAKEELFESNVQTEKLLWHAFRKSAVVKKIWGDLRSQFDPLQKFAVLTLRTTSGDSQAVKTVRNMFESLDKTIKFTAVYPHMMILFHILSQKRFELYLPILGKSLDTAVLMTYLYRGDIPPLFQYVDDEAPISAVEMFYAFDFAVRTNLFGIMNIDPDFFIADAVRRMSENQVKFVRDNMHNRTLRFNQTDSYGTWKRMCAEFSGAQPPRWSFYIKELRESPYYGKTIETAFTSISDKSSSSAVESGALTRLTQGLNYIDTEFTEAIEEVRVDMAQFIRMAEAMKTSYVSYLKKAKKLDQSEIDKKTVQTDTLVKEISALRKAFIEEVMIRHEDIGRCFAKSMLKDYEVQQQMLRMERAHLRQIYRDMTKIRQGGLGEAEVQALNGKYAFQGLPDQFAGYDQFDGDGFRYNKIDLWVRMSQYLKTGLVTESESFVAVAPHIRVDMGQSLSLDTDIIKENKSHYIPYTKSEDEFVAEGMKIILANKDPFVVWYSYPTGRVNRWDARQLALTSLFRMEPGIVDGKYSVPATELIEEHFDLMKIMRLTPFERQIFSEIKQGEKFEPIYFMNRFVSYSLTNTRIRDVWGLFDSPARLAVEQLLGYTFELNKVLKDPEMIDPIAASMARSAMPKRDGFLDLGESYFRSRAKQIRGKLLISFNEDLDLDLDRRVTKWIQWEQKAIGLFEQAMNNKFTEYRTLPVEDQPRVDINMLESVTEPWVSPNILGDFKVRIKRFHQRTDACFKGITQCPSFANEL